MMGAVSRYAKLIGKLAKIACSKEVNKDAEYRRTIFYSFRAWGGVYIKFLQILASNSKFLDGWGGPQEMQVFAQAPREEIKISDYIDVSKFAWISEAPVAAGSFALVYRGQLKTQEDVAIKILRPSIRDNLKRDLRTLRRLCRFFSKMLPKYLVDYNEAYDACAKMFLAETDYMREMANQEYFAKLYQNSSSVVIPKVYREFSGKHVIVQEFVAGPTMADVMSAATPEKPAADLAKELTGSDLWSQIVLAGSEALYMAMCADFVYGDPHPGNIILLPNDRIAFIDFGVIASKPTSHLAFYEWVKSYFEVLEGQDSFDKLLETTVTCFCPDLSLAMRKCNFVSGDLLTILASAMTEKLNLEFAGNQSYVQTFRDGHLLDVFLKVVSTKVIEVKVEMINFELLKAMQAFLGSVTILDNASSHRQFSEIMHRSIEYALKRAEATGVPNDTVMKTRYSLTESYELLLKTISNLAANDEHMFNLVQERIFA